MAQNQPIIVELAEDQALLDRHLASGEFDSASDVLRAGLYALDREQAEFEQTTRTRLRDRTQARPAKEVLERLRQRHFQRWGKMPSDV